MIASRQSSPFCAPGTRDSPSTVVPVSNRRHRSAQIPSWVGSAPVWQNYRERKTHAEESTKQDERLIDRHSSETANPYNRHTHPRLILSLPVTQPPRSTTSYERGTHIPSPSLPPARPPTSPTPRSPEFAVTPRRVAHPPRSPQRRRRRRPRWRKIPYCRGPPPPQTSRQRKRRHLSQVFYDVLFVLGA